MRRFRGPSRDLVHPLAAHRVPRSTKFTASLAPEVVDRRTANPRLHLSDVPYLERGQKSRGETLLYCEVVNDRSECLPNDAPFVGLV
jgi:hypothetical protein